MKQKVEIDQLLMANDLSVFDLVEKQNLLSNKRTLSLRISLRIRKQTEFMIIRNVSIGYSEDFDRSSGRVLKFHRF